MSAHLTHEQVFTATHRATPQQAHSAPNRHSYHVVAWCLEGSGTMQTLTPINLSPGVLYLMPAGTPHLMREGGAVTVRAVGFCGGCLRRDGLEALLAPFDRVWQGASLALQLDDDALERLNALFSQLHTTCVEDRAQRELAQRAALTLLLVEVARQTSRQESARAGRDARVAEALRLIEARCLEPIGLSDIAAQLHLSPAYLTTRVRQETGLTVQGWIIAHRMAEARRLLQHGDELVEIVAERVGYADATHFTRLFRRHHGATPGAWRALHQRSSSR